MPTRFGLLLSALAVNVDAYRHAAQRVRRYRPYALCSHQELERRQILRLLTEDLPKTRMPFPLRGRLLLFVRRAVVRLRILFHSETMILRDLWANDLALVAQIEEFLEDVGPDVLTQRYLNVYARLIDDTVQEMAEILQSRLRHADRARAAAFAAARPDRLP